MKLLRIATGSFGFVVAAAALAATGTAGGVRWSIPAHWTQQPAKTMRVATYTIPGKAGAESAECAVFHFGRGDGGGLQDNITRWAQQFDGSPKPKTSDQTVRGMAVHRVDISGTYLSPGGPMMKSQGAKSGYRLLGAIVEAPGGFVFFKCVGPAATISAAEKDIESLIASIEKAGSSF